MTDPDPVDATLVASRALLGVIARSVSDALQSVTLPQLRILVVLSSTGPLRIGALAEKMHANPSTFSRTIDRMVTGGWVDRATSVGSRREVLVHLTEDGHLLVDDVTHRRRRELATILDRLDDGQRNALEDALITFAEAAGEPSNESLLVLGL